MFKNPKVYMIIIESVYHTQTSNLLPPNSSKNTHNPNHACYEISCAVSSSSNINLNENGSNGIPSPIKCLLIASTQCNLSACNIALVPSITTKTAIVRKNHRKNAMTTAGTPMAPVMLRPFWSVIFQRTWESC